MPTYEKILQRMQVMADSDPGTAELAKSMGSKKIRKMKNLRSQMRLVVFSDSEAIKLAGKLYSRYVSDRDSSGFLQFAFLLDRFMQNERRKVKHPTQLEGDMKEEGEEEEQNIDELQEKFNKARKAAGNDDDVEMSSVIARLNFFTEESYAEVNESKLPKPLKQFLSDIRQRDAFHAYPHAKLEAEGSLVLKHTFRNIFDKNSYKALASMIRRSTGDRVVIRGDKNSGGLVFRSGSKTFLLSPMPKSKGVSLARLSMVSTQKGKKK